MRKINWKNLSKWATGAFLICGITIPIPLLVLNASTGQNNFVLGNYQSYMSPDVMKTLNANYSLSFDYFETVENAKRLLKRNTIDISNTTSYELRTWITEGLVKKLDWAQFEIPSISNASDALNWFTEPVRTILEAPVNDQGDILLDYGIPYFLQDLVFVYRGAQITELSNNADWATIFNAVANETRFKPEKLPNVVALNDQRSIYSIPRLIQTANDNLNPQSNATIGELTDTYTYLNDRLNAIGSNSISFNSDSNAVLNKVALNEVNAGIMFNGDAIYAASGGDDALVINEDDFHCLKPDDTLVALDLMVINSQISDTKLSKSYEIIKQLCLNNGQADVNEESLTFQNFDFVNYTPPLSSIYDYVIDPDNEYFDNPSQIEMLTIENVNSKQIELPIDDLTKSNFSFAWIGFKSRLQ